MSTGYTGFYEDGYEEKGYIAAEKNLYPALRFTFRPVLVQERNRHVADNAKLGDPAKGTLNTARLLALKVKGWDLKFPAKSKRKGEVVPLNPDNILKMQPALYERFWMIVLGLAASDDDPEATIEQQEESLVDQLAAADADKGPSTIGAAREERNEKNSSTG